MDHFATAANEPVPPTLVMPGRRQRAGAGLDWIGEGWSLFRKAIVMWIVVLVLFFLLHVGLGLLPYVGIVAGNIVAPVVMGGVVLGCRSLETGGELEVEHLLGGFRRNTRELLLVGAIYAGGQLLILFAFGLFVGYPFLAAIVRGDEAALANLVPADMESLWPLVMRLLLGSLVAMALAVPLMAAYWFAPPLVMMHGMPAVRAMQASFWAALRNFLPFLVYGLAMTGLLVLAMLPFALGLFAWLPLLIATVYTSYRGVFTQAEGEPQGTPRATF
jgi:uncharacterized membrane protein